MGKKRTSVTFSVTRLGEISLTFYKSWQCFEGLFNIWQNCEPTLETFDANGQKFIVEFG